MKILLIHNAYQQFGGEDVVFGQEQELLKCAGHQVYTYHRSNSELNHHSALKRLTLAGQMVWARDSRRDIAGLLAKTKPDLVHIHNTFLMISPSVYYACKKAGIPVVQTLHNYRLLCPASDFFRDGHVCEDCQSHSMLRGVVHGCYHNSRMETCGVALMLAVHRSLATWTQMVDRFIALTGFSRQKFIEGGLPAEKIAVKPNFVFADPGSRVGNGEYALFIGRLSADKGVLTVLSAWKQLEGRIPLRIIGDGPQRASLQSYAMRAGLSTVQFLGELPRDKVIEALKGARCLLFTSEWYETFGMAMIEAFACGVPVIASRLGAMQEVVENGRTGVHFAPGDPEDLRTKVEWLWSHREEASAMGRAARAQYEARYTAERNYQMLMEIYREVMPAAA